MTDRPPAQVKAQVTVFENGSAIRRADRIVTEEPLEIRVSRHGRSTGVAVTMRTPGSDFELATGFLLGEGVVTARDQISAISYCRDEGLPADQLYNIVIVEVDGSANLDLDHMQRHFQMTSACGVCGKSNLDAISLRGISRIETDAGVSTDVITALPDRLRDSQRLFETTGGLHAAGLFDLDGRLVANREDVGRHNAVDKLLGWAFLNDRVPLDDHILMVSGRSSFEIAQKALVARIPFLCSVSAPSSLAVDLAKEFGMTLVGFLRDDRFNAYAGVERISR